MSATSDLTTDLAEAPTMYYCLDNIGGYDGFFDGEHVLASAGVAYRNPGSDQFSLGIPAEPASLVVDSGGFQAATRWNGAKACERGLHGRYPYSPTELHEWAEKIGADVVAGMDVACETAAKLFGADGFEKGYIWPGDYRDRLLESLDYQRRQQRVYEQGEYSHALMPVIQGNTLADYEQFLWLMQTEGLDQYDRLALGTVCKRTDRDAILEIVQLVREYYPDKHLHLFGATLRIWQDQRFAGLFDSADTAAWNWGGRSKAHKKTLFRAYAQRVAQCQQTIDKQTRFSEQSSGIPEDDNARRQTDPPNERMQDREDELNQITASTVAAAYHCGGVFVLKSRDNNFWSDTYRTLEDHDYQINKYVDNRLYVEKPSTDKRRDR